MACFSTQRSLWKYVPLNNEWMCRFARLVMESQLLPFQIKVCVCVCSCVCVCVMPQVEETQVVTSVTLLADLEDLSVLWWVATGTGSEQGRQPFSCRAGLPSKMIFLCTQPKGASLVFNLSFWLIASYNTPTASSSFRVSDHCCLFLSLPSILSSLQSLRGAVSTEEFVTC